MKMVFQMEGQGRNTLVFIFDMEEITSDKILFSSWLVGGEYS